MELSCWNSIAKEQTISSKSATKSAQSNSWQFQLIEEAGFEKMFFAKTKINSLLRARVSSSSQVSQEALIAQILSSIQPQISSAVQGTLSSQTAGRRTVAVAAPRQQPVRVAAPRPIAPRYNFKTRISSKAQFQASSRSGRTFFAQSGADLLVARQPRRRVRQRGDECEVRDAPVPV